jgi:hypothetical protein
MTSVSVSYLRLFLILSWMKTKLNVIPVVSSFSCHLW